MRKGLTAYQLKIIAIIAMAINHLAHIVVLLPIDKGVMNTILIPMNMVGKLTIPIMCFFVAEGYYHTHDLKKYLLRMFIFAAISQIPFYLFENNLPTDFTGFIAGFLHFNVIFSLAMGLLALTIWKSERLHSFLKILLVAVVTYLTKNSDWRIFAVLWILVFAAFRGDFKKQAAAFIILAAVRVFIYYIEPGLNPAFSVVLSIKTVILQSGTVLALIPLYFYNGQLGRKTKYGFYIFYPAHLLVLAAIKFIIMG